MMGVNQITIPAGTVFGDAAATTDDIVLNFPPNAVTVGPGGTLTINPTATITINMGGTAYADLNALVAGLGGTPGLVGAGLDAALNTDIRYQLDNNVIVDRSMLAPATAASYNLVSDMNRPVVIDAQASTNMGKNFSANQSQDGYGFGDLSSWNVDSDGVLYGIYSNGVTLPLWQVTLYDFTCTQGLRREGNNLFSQTRDSGEHKFGAAGVSGLGTISGYALEQSNVDMSTEFVQMISTQRGFQANSKVITTTDTMLDTVINMKR